MIRGVRRAAKLFFRCRSVRQVHFTVRAINDVTTSLRSLIVDQTGTVDRWPDPGAALASWHGSAQVLVANPYVTGFEGWTSTYTTAPTQVGPPPAWGVLLTPDPLSGQRFLFEAS